MVKIWYDNGTDTYFEAGDRVNWLDDSEEIEGTLKWIDEDYFCVEWDDNKTVKYSAMLKGNVLIEQEN